MLKRIKLSKISIIFASTLSLITTLSISVAPISSATTSQTFTYTGAPQMYVVPLGVTSIAVVLEGASGASPNGGGRGGKGGRVKASIAVTPGEVLEIQVGGQGGASNGYNGGGEGGGGGATDIRRPTFNTSTSCAFTLSCGLSDRIIVAGGGGGGGGYLGVPPVDSFVQGGNGGYFASGGNFWNSDFNSLGMGDATGGNSGTQFAGGNHGFGTFYSPGANAGSGSLGVGGSGAWVAQAMGGGGGGGYYGGGGGGVSENSSSQENGAGGGGGGASWADGVGVTPYAHGPYEDGFVTGDGSVTIDIPSAITNATFGYKGMPQFYTVPNESTALSVRLYGAGTGQHGDIVYGNLPVTSGEILQINVGGRGWGGDRHLPTGVSAGQGGWNGGGDGQPDSVWGGGGGGAGATDIRRCTPATLLHPCGPQTRMVVSGGGGFPSCGNWGLNGGDGGSFLDGRGGNRGNPSADPTMIGGGGTLTAGGASWGSAGVGETLTAGEYSKGGSALVSAQCGGNGGGGGLYGGGGSKGDGGGGGSSCASTIETCTSSSNVLGITGAAFAHSQGSLGSIADGMAIITAMPVAFTGNATQITSTTATISGTINPKFLASTPTLFFSTSHDDVEACSAAGVVGNCPSVNSEYLVSNNGSWDSSSTFTLAGTTTQSISGGLSGLSANTNYYYRICAQSVAGYGCGLTQSFSTQLSITTSSLPNGRVGVSYSQQLAASGGSGTYTQWSVTSGALPAGLHLDTTTGTISGTPTAVHSDTATYEVTDSSNGTATRTLTINITTPPQNASPSTPSAPTQQSRIISIAPDSGLAETPTSIVITGQFIEEVLSIQINGVPLETGSWNQTANTITFLLPNKEAGLYSIQIFNGAIPVLDAVTFTVKVSPPPVIVLPTPKPTPTPLPTTPTPPSIIHKAYSLNIHFGMGSADINTANMKLLNHFASHVKMASSQRLPITITAYTQPTPHNPDPQSLAHRRAKAVEIALLKLGIRAHFTLVIGGDGPVNQAKYRLAKVETSITN